MPRAVAYSNFRRDLKSWMRRANDDATPVLVTSTDPSCNVVVMGADDYDSLMETVRICENPGLRDKIVKGLADARAGRVHGHALLEDEDDRDGASTI